MTPDQAKSSWRVPLVVGGGVLIQLAVIAQFRFLGVVPDVVPVLIVSVGLLGGSSLGAMTGFAAGFLIDLTLVQMMGVSSLLLTIAGYFAGRLRELHDPVHPLTNSLIGAGASIFFTAGFAVMQFSLGQPAPQAVSVLWQILMSGVYGALLAPLVFRIARWALLPMIGDGGDPVHRRRRATTTSTSVLMPPTRGFGRRSRRQRRGRGIG